MLETTIEARKADVPFIQPKMKVTTNGKEMVVLEVQEDANDPIATMMELLSDPWVVPI